MEHLLYAFFLLAVVGGAYAAFRWIRHTFESWLSRERTPAPLPEKIGPSTAAESLIAKQQITVAGNLLTITQTALNQAYSLDNFEFIHKNLKVIANSLAQARSLDPSVTLYKTEGRDTLDMLMAEACYLEARNRYAFAVNQERPRAPERFNRSISGRIVSSERYYSWSDDRRHERMRAERIAKALPPIDKAIHYQPHNIKYHIEKVKTLLEMGSKSEARAAADEGLKIDLANITLLTMREY